MRPTDEKVMGDSDMITDGVYVVVADTTKRPTLVPGGNRTGHVLPNLEPGATAENLIWCDSPNFQTCAAMKRLNAQAGENRNVCGALMEFAPTLPVGDSRDETPIPGRVATESQFGLSWRPVQKAQFLRRTLLTCAPEKSPSYALSIIANLSADEPLFEEAQLGPVMQTVTIGDPDDAVPQAYDSGNRPGSSVRPKDTGLARPVARRGRNGSAWIHKRDAIQSNVPSAVVKSPGIADKFGKEGLAERADIPDACC